MSVFKGKLGVLVWRNAPAAPIQSGRLLPILPFELLPAALHHHVSRVEVPVTIGMVAACMRSTALLALECRARDHAGQWMGIVEQSPQPLRRALDSRVFPQRCSRVLLDDRRSPRPPVGRCQRLRLRGRAGESGLLERREGGAATEDEALAQGGRGQAVRSVSYAAGGLGA